MSLPNRYAQGTNIATRIKDPERNGVFTGGQCAEIDSEDLMPTIRDTIIGEHRYPGCSILTRVSLFDFASDVINNEPDARCLCRNLRLRLDLDRRRRVVDINRFTHALASELLAGRIIWSVGGNNFDYVPTIGE